MQDSVLPQCELSLFEWKVVWIWVASR